MAEVKAHPVIGIVLLLAFFIAFGYVLYCLYRKRSLHIKLMETLFPGKVETGIFFLWPEFLRMDFSTWIWVNSPIYYTRVSESELNAEGKILHRKLQKASSQVLVSVGLYLLYFVVFWLVAKILIYFN